MNVVAINPRINESCVDMLRDALARAERGEIVGCTVVSVMADGAIIDGWSSGDYNRFSMLGGIEALKRDYLNREIEAR